MFHKRLHGIICLATMVALTEALSFVAPRHSLISTWQSVSLTTYSSSSSPLTCSRWLDMKVNKGGRGGSGGGRAGDGTLAVINSERLQKAGRRGTKRFVDPTKVFVGNLPFDATEENMMKFFFDTLGTTFNVKSVKIIRDWKTNKSKGYGFALFTDPMFATSAMEICKNQKLLGRTLTFSQGQKKIDPNTLHVKKTKKTQNLTDEEMAIHQGLQEAEDGEVQDEEEEEDISIEEMISLKDFDETSDDLLFGDVDDNDDDDDDDFQFDGVFEEMYPTEYDPLTEEELKMNREQRREAATKKKRRKLPHKGFEAPLNL